MTYEIDWDALSQPTPLKRRGRRPLCGARKQDGESCRNPAEWDDEAGQARNGRCKYHGGLCTGPKTKAGKAAIAAAQRKRWAEYRARKAQETQSDASDSS